jgi:hypothetical protein
MMRTEGSDAQGMRWDLTVRPKGVYLQGMDKSA